MKGLAWTQREERTGTAEHRAKTLGVRENCVMTPQQPMALLQTIAANHTAPVPARNGVVAKDRLRKSVKAASSEAEGQCQQQRHKSRQQRGSHLGQQP